MKQQVVVGSEFDFLPVRFWYTVRLVLYVCGWWLNRVNDY